MKLLFGLAVLVWYFVGILILFWLKTPERLHITCGIIQIFFFMAFYTYYKDN